METKAFERQIKYAFSLTPLVYVLSDTWHAEIFRTGASVSARVYHTAKYPEWAEATCEVFLDAAEDLTQLRTGNGSAKARVIMTPYASIQREACVFLGDFRVTNKSMLDLTLRVTERYAITQPICPCEPVSSDFERASALTDAVLVIGEKVLHVNRFMLAAHSTFFDKLFFSDFAEKFEDKIALRDLDYDAFVEFLRVIHPERKNVCADTVRDLLVLADRFGSPTVRRECAAFLTRDNALSVVEKLKLAERYGMRELEEPLIQRMSKSALIAVGTAGKNVFSDRLMTRLFNRLF